MLLPTDLVLLLLGYGAFPETQDSKVPRSKDPSTWSVDDVVWFIRETDPQALGPHADVFRKHVSPFLVWLLPLLGCI